MALSAQVRPILGLLDNELSGCFEDIHIPLAGFIRCDSDSPHSVSTPDTNRESAVVSLVARTALMGEFRRRSKSLASCPVSDSPHRLSSPTSTYVVFTLCAAAPLPPAKKRRCLRIVFSKLSRRAGLMAAGRTRGSRNCHAVDSGSQ